MQTITPQRPHSPDHRSHKRPLRVVVNARASRINAAAIKDLQAAFEAVDADFELVATRTLDELDKAINDVGDRRLVLAGGDGALHAAANLRMSLPEIALVPLGSANNIAHALRVPADLLAAADLAVNGRATPLDVLEVWTPNRRIVAVEGVSAGFQAEARARYNAVNSGAVARGAVALARTLVQLPHYSAKISLDADGVATEAFEQLFFSTLPRFSFGLQVNPNADVRDGVGEAIALRAPTRRRAASLLAATRTGAHLGRNGVSERRFRRAQILDAVPMAADGEPLGTTMAEIRVVPGALDVVTGIEG